MARDCDEVPASASVSRSRMRIRHVPAHRRAFHRFYREHFGLVWSMVRRFGVPTAQHEDAVQEVWLVAYRRLHTLEPDASAKAWLSTITRRVASRLRRTEHRRRRKIAAIELTADRPESGSASSSVETQDARRLLDALFARLDDDQRAALVLAHVHGLTGPEIARSLDIPLNTAYSRLRLARRKVQRFAGEVGTEQAIVLRALRCTEQPPPRAAARAWVLLVPELSRGVAAAAAGGAAAGTAATGGTASGATALVGVKAGVMASVGGGISSLKIFAVTVGVGVLGLTATRAAVDEPSTVAVPAGVVEVERTVSARTTAAVLGGNDAGADARADARASVRSAGVLRDGVEASEASEAKPGDGRLVDARSKAATTGADGLSSGEESHGRTGSRGASLRSGLRGAGSRPDGVDATTLGDEAALLGRAQGSLRAGNPGEALRLLEEHERRFPAGKLVDARRGARVRALCDLGRGAQARAEAKLLASRHPDSPVAAGVLDSCT